jgi:hypothetical protein
MELSQLFSRGWCGSTSETRGEPWACYPGFRHFGGFLDPACERGRLTGPRSLVKMLGAPIGTALWCWVHGDQRPRVKAGPLVFLDSFAKCCYDLRTKPKGGGGSLTERQPTSAPVRRARGNNEARQFLGRMEATKGDQDGYEYEYTRNVLCAS